MIFNFCQLLILFGLLQGVISIITLMGSSSVKSKSNYYLSALIFCFIANIGQYWLKDVGLIDYNTMQLIFLPWLILIAPLFYFYVYSLKIFNVEPFKRWLFFIPLFILLSIHFVIKFLIISKGAENWNRPDWIGSFYLIEEIIAMVFCLVVTFIVYRLIKKEKNRPNYNGFGVNKTIVNWIVAMMQMGLVLALIWLVSLYVVNQNQNFRTYYFLWIAMTVTLNVLGSLGIHYTRKEGGFSEYSLTNDLRNIKYETNNLSKVMISTPQKYVNQKFLDSIFQLGTKFSSATTLPNLHELFRAWFDEEFGIKEIIFSDEESATLNARDEKNFIRIPYSTESNKKEFIKIRTLSSETFDQSLLYYFSSAVKAFTFHIDRIASISKSSKLDKNNKVYKELIKLFHDEELFSDPNLDLNNLANKLEVSTGYLSKVINEITDKSFNEFINEYRVEKVKSLMADQNYSHFTIAGYGQEAGFNSKSTYYKAFQKSENLSPGKYLESITKLLQSE